ncbi:MAG: hypothetical protein AB4038_19205 [Prochloraceae cyanobacterium]
MRIYRLLCDRLKGYKLKLVSQFIGEFTSPQDSLNDQEVTKTAIKKWNYLLNYDRELDKNYPLSDDEIKIICQFLSQHNKTRPVELAKSDFTIPENLNELLPS